MEQDRVTEPVPVPVPARSLLEGLDLGVGRLEVGVGRLQDDGVDDPPQVRAEHIRDLHHRAKSRTRHPADEAFPTSLRPSSRFVVPQPASDFLHRPCPSNFEGRIPQRVEPSLVLRCHVLRVLKPEIACPDERPVPERPKLSGLLGPHLVHPVAEVLRDVEPVEADLELRILDVAADCVDVRRPHVHGDRLQRQDVLQRRVPEEVLEVLLLAPVEDVEHSGSLDVVHDGHVLVPLLEGGLVDADPTQRLRLTALQPPFDGPLHDAVDFVPTHPEHLSDRRDGCRLQPVDDERFEQGGEPRPRARPGNWDLLDAVFLAPHPGDICR